MRFILISLFLISFSAHAQIVEIPMEYFVNNQISANQKVSYSGTPYLYEIFKPATIFLKDKKYDVNIKLNAFKQQFEILQDGNIRVISSSPNMRVILKDYTFVCKSIDNKTIPVIELVDGQTSLAKFFISTYTPSKPATSSYDKPRLANYSLETRYVLQFSNEEQVAFKLNKKNVQRLFSQHAAVLSYMKKNKLRFRKESELVYLVNYLNK